MEYIMEKKNTIEQNFEKIESIISDMNKEDVTLDRSFELYNKGLGLIKDCNGQIDKIDKKIKVLNEGIDE